MSERTRYERVMDFESVDCARCGKEPLVGSVPRWWPTMWQAFLVGDDVLCGECAQADLGDNNAIQLPYGRETAFEEYREIMEKNL